MTVVIVHCWRTRGQTEALLERHADEACVVVEEDWGFDRGSDTSIRTRSVYDFFGIAQYEEVIEFWQRFAGGWFGVDGRDVTGILGIPVGPALSAWDTLATTLPVLRSALCASSIIRQHSPRLIYLGHSDTYRRDVWKRLAVEAGIKVVCLYAEVPDGSLDPMDMDCPVHKIEHREPASIKQVPSRVGSGEKKGPRVLLGETEKKLSILAMSGITPASLRAVGLAPVPFGGTGYRFLRFVISTLARRWLKRLARRRSRTVARADKRFFSYRGWDLSDWLVPQLRERLETELSELWIDVLTLDLYLRILRPKLYISGNNSDTIRRARRLVARHRSIPTVVCPGFPLRPGRSEFEPGIADYIVAQGQSTVDWAVEFGVPADCMIVCGDHGGLLHKGNRSDIPSWLLAAPSQGPGAKERRVLVVDSPFMRLDFVFTPIQRFRFAEVVLGMARRLPDTRFVVKFHPYHTHINGEGADANQRYVEFFTESDASNISFAPLDSSIDDYLAETDCVVCQADTFVCYQAIAMEKPLVVVVPQGYDRFLSAFHKLDIAAQNSLSPCRYAHSSEQAVQAVSASLSEGVAGLPPSKPVLSWLLSKAADPSPSVANLVSKSH